MKAKKKKTSSELLRERLKKTAGLKGAFSTPPSPIPDARLNPSGYQPPKAPEGFAERVMEKLSEQKRGEETQPEAPSPEGKKRRKDTRLKTKGILFRMEPRLYEALLRCASTDDELTTITDIITRGAVKEVDRIIKKFNGNLKTPPPERMDKSRELLDKTLENLPL